MTEQKTDVQLIEKYLKLILELTGKRIKAVPVTEQGVELQKFEEWVGLNNQKHTILKILEFVESSPDRKLEKITLANLAQNA